MCLGLWLVLECLMAMLGTTEGQTPPSDGPRHTLENLITSVPGADFYVYNLQDDMNNQMACVKVIQSTRGNYWAVSHSNPPSLGGVFAVALQNSTDLKHWHFVRQLGQHASQPYIYEDSNGGFVVAWEQDPQNHIHLLYFDNENNLLNGVASHTLDIPQTLSRCAEGTPNIYSVEFLTNPPSILKSVIHIGAHFYDNCVHDRQQDGNLTNWNTWRTGRYDNINNAILYWGVGGNIGARDSIQFEGFQFGLVEGMFVEGDFCSWRMFVYDYQTHNADPLNIVTHLGSKSFGNPRISLLKVPDGRTAILVSYFLFCANGAEGGPLLYYKIMN